MVEIIQLLGWIATILFTIMLFPQIVKTIRLKDTKGVSLFFFFIYLIANIVALIYAFLIKEPPLVIKYELGIVVSFFYIVLFVYYKKRN